ncbi:Autoinducer 2 (AI-2) modifying protein LsrG [Klebsiella pneumoniae]|uniref:Autoinducer 2 (AI-2) modifying protein LsrG n=1 Tax=Klebsiella pneumoniae TaxID=573 RepID=A0A377U0W0_KLEPN|nr:Autoinducer 2 (AI-2) modifying protein LsrG [Klebsiella pneumoniae]
MNVTLVEINIKPSGWMSFSRCFAPNHEGALREPGQPAL